MKRLDLLCAWARRSATMASLAVAMMLTGVAHRASADTLPADKLPETPLADSTTGPVGDYLRTVHAHIHRRWADNFLRLIGEQMPAVNPLNDPSKVAEVDLVVGPDGQLLSTKVSQSSGFPGFDDAVIEVLRDAVPFPLPPPATRSDDDKLHLHWVFARDQRRCSGVAMVRAYDPVEVAIPKLLRTGRREEALARVTMARGAGQHAEPMFSVLAQDWNKASLHEPWANPRMARIVAERGDDEGVRWLKAALRRPEWTAEAGAALVSLKVPVCSLVSGWFATESTNDQQLAAMALATSSDPACIPGLTKLLENPKAHPEARATAAVALGAIDDNGARKTLANLSKDPATHVTVRAAALLAQVRPGAGRRSVIAMETLLRDPSPELRAAANAGVVRAGGDSNLADLYMLFKENDARPALAALRELDRVPSEESTKMIARLAHRPQLPVQKAAAEILVRRGAKDAFATLRPFLEPGTDPELRALALVAADEPELAKAGANPKLTLAAFRARLARGERDQAADLFLAFGKGMTPADQATAMTYWLTTAPPPAIATATTAESKPTAVRSPR